MSWYDIFRRPSPTTFYVIGMILVILGLGCLIISADPRPLSKSFTVPFLVIGLLFFAGGSSLLIVVSRLKSDPVLSPNRIAVNDTVNSAADLLDNDLYDESGETSHAAYQNTVESLESVQAVSQCMMTNTKNAPSPTPTLFYKETFV